MHAFKKVKDMRRILAVFGLMALLVGTALAEQRTLAVVGEGTANGVPDIGSATLGVTTRAAEAAEALSQSSAAMARIIAEAEAAGVAPTDMRTEQVSLFQEYDQRPRQEGPPQLVGYQASSSLHVKLRSLPEMGAVIDRLARAGANTVGGITLAIDDPAPLLEQARREAVADALARARLYAEAAAVVLGPILSIREPGLGDPPGPGITRFTAEAAPVPIVPGQSTVSARVIVVFEISHQPD